MGEHTAEVLEVLCREIREADIKKFNAESNITQSGGGARDLRFPIKFEACLSRLFPRDITYEKDVPYRDGNFKHLNTQGEMVTERLRYAFQPTDARPNEVRIAQTDKVGFLGDIPKYTPEDGLLFLAFIRTTETVPQVQYLTEKQMSAPDSNQVIAAAMREAISQQKGNAAVIFTATTRMVTTMQDQLALKANEILSLLKENKNVLLTGAPATGKTTLLNLVAEAFENPSRTVFDPYGSSAFPTDKDSENNACPSAECHNRKVFRTTFHQGTKYRDFVRGLTPVPDKNSVRFEVSKGLLWRASEYAKKPDSASLVIIDEINRGPAVSIFGDTISAFEADKRLDEDGNIIPDKTVTLQIINDNAELEDYQLPSRLYFLAAMNQADSSVEPMDAAFIRRWKRYKLPFSANDLYAYFEVDSTEDAPKEKPESAKDVYELAIQALCTMNEKIALGRGEDYQIGQGVFMGRNKDELPGDLPGALHYIASCWPVIDAHIEEVFFNDKEAIAEVLNADSGTFFKVSNFTFANRPTIAIEQPAITENNVYSMLLSLVE